jgi:heme A synthase
MTEFIANLHFINMALVLATGFITGVWGLVLFFMKKTMNRPWRIALIVTGIVAALQGLLGITLVLMGERPGTGTDLYYLHYVYGAIVVLAIPVAITYVNGKNPRRDVLIFSIAALILVAAAVRALMTGPHPG